MVRLDYVRCIYCIFAQIFMLDFAPCFNVDTRTARTRTGPTGSMFGYSVAQHTDVSGTQWLLVGAPKATTRQPKVENGGAVYRCRTDKGASECIQIPFDTRGSNIQWNGTDYLPKEDKSYQWFGATVQSSMKGKIVACAPRYVYFSIFLNKRDPVGTCWVAESSLTTFKEFSPCRTAADRESIPDLFRGQNFCQAGTSAILSKDGRRLIIGGVGSYYWQGQIFSKDLTEPDDGFAPYYQQTWEGPPETDDQYRGYSLTLGDFNGDGVQDIATGVPKADALNGSVSVYNENLTNIANVSGDQIGAYFGYSLTCADWNGDGLDDLAVGAPLYTDYTSNTYETGSVYMFYQQQHGPKRRFGKSEQLFGEGRTGSRFGFSLSPLNDINNDGFNDLVVGAPYDGEEKSGAIYIFHGSLSGIIKKFSQVILSSQVSGQLSTFGFSVSGGRDQDANVYPDILVGAYQSDTAVLLRSRPIVRMEADLSFEPDMIDLDRKLCNLTDGTEVTCVSVVTCLMYSGLKVPSEIVVELNWKLDSSFDKAQRVLYLSGNQRQFVQNSTIKLQKKMRYCKTSYGYIKKSIRDKLSPISAELTYSLVNVVPADSDELMPVMDQYIPFTTTGQAQILKNCGVDNTCIPDLVLTAKSLSPPHVIGTNDFIDIAIKVVNRGEDAYEAQVKIKLPSGVSYVNVYQTESKVTVTCSSMEQDKEYHVICNIGNPLPAKAELDFQLRTSPDKLTGSADTIQYFLHANSSNPENHTTMSSNFAAVNIEIQAYADIRITGVSKPEQVVYNASYADVIEHERDIGPAVFHLYEVRNFGPSSIESASIEILWPGFLSEDKPLMYLTEVPMVIKGTGTCRAAPSEVNYLNLTLDEVPKMMSSIDGETATHTEMLTKSRAYAVSGTSLWKRQNSLKDKLTCNTGWCSVISCDTGFLSPDDNILIQVKSRVWLQTLIKGRYRGVKISSQAVARVQEVPYNFRPHGVLTDTFQVNTYVAPQHKWLEARPIDLWIVLVAAGVGLLIFILIVIIMWRCGFFKRRKPEDTEELDANRDNGSPNNGNNGKYKSYNYDDDQL